jgi:hypothetical protein
VTDLSTIFGSVQEETMTEIEPRPADEELGMLVAMLVASGCLDQDDGHEDIHPLSDQQATVGIWIDGHEYSLTLNRED